MTWPDVRGWATIGMFFMAAMTLLLAVLIPGAAQNELFKTLATLLFGTGGFGLVCSYLWGGSKASVTAVDTVNAIAANASPPAPPSPTPTPLTDPPAPVEVTGLGGGPVQTEETRP